METELSPGGIDMFLNWLATQIKQTVREILPFEDNSFEEESYPEPVKRLRYEKCICGDMDLQCYFLWALRKEYITPEYLEEKKFFKEMAEVVKTAYKNKWLSVPMRDIDNIIADTLCVYQKQLLREEKQRKG